MLNANAWQTFAKSTTLAAVLWAAPLHAQVVNLTPNQAIALASDALRNERPDQAAVAMDALLRQFPESPTALLLRTEAAILLGDFPGAVRFGQQAFWNATNDTQRFNASRLIALGHARQLQDSRAQLWLRAARQYAPNEAASESVARDFQVLRQRNPLSMQARIGITPSTNINNGTFNETIEFFGLPFELSEDAVAQSGWEFSGATSLRYRLHTNSTSATFLDASISGTTFALTENSRQEFANLRESEQETLRTRLNAQQDAQETQIATIETLLANSVTLSPEARAELEASLATLEDELLTDESIEDQVDGVREVTGSSFSYAQLRLGAAHVFALAPDVGITEAGLHYSRSFRKDEDERHRVTASLSHRYAVSDTASVSAFGVLERSRYVVGGDEAQSMRMQATYNQRLDSIGTFSFGYGLERALGDRNTDEYDATTYSLSFRPAEQVFGADLGLSLIYREIDWDEYQSTGPRADEILTARATATMRDVEVFGFNPVLGIERTDRDSNGVRFQNNSTTFSFDIVSSF